MAIHTTSNERARYPFLTRPPPPQKKQPTRAPPSPPIAVALPLSASVPRGPVRHRTSGIAAWAALVQPGSPAPRSPHRRPSTANSRRGSLSRIGRRSSISHSCAPDGSLGGLIYTPTSARDADIDISAFGYTSVFVHVPPKTPSTPAHLVHTSLNPPMAPLTATIGSSSKKAPTARTIKRFRSLGILRSRAKATSRSSVLPPPTKATAIGVRARAELISKRKKAKYAHVRPPPPLGNEIALMQFADGGSVEANVRRAMEAQARAVGGNLGVADVYRDGKGGLWWDQDEEMEYAHLLGGDIEGETAEGQWIKFGNEKNEDDISPKTGLVDLAELKRESVSTQDSDLDSRYLVVPAEENQCGPEDIILSFVAPPKSPFEKNSPIAPGLSVLSLPSRPRRAAKHLHKPEFLVDIAAFGPRSPGIQVRSSPKSSCFPATLPPTPRTPLVPKSPRFSSTFVVPPTGGARKKVKRRPTPLKLTPVTSAAAGWQKVDVAKTPLSVAVSRTMSGSSLGVIAEARREFVEASFAPKPTILHVPKPTNADPRMHLAEERKPQRGKIILASLDPKDDMSRCKEWAGMMGVDVGVDVNVSTSSGNAARKRRLGLGGFFGRK